MLNCLLAICLQLGIGYTHANPQDCGIWYLCGPNEPYVRHLNSGTYSAGVEGDSFRAGVEYLGKFGTDSRVPPVNYHITGKEYGIYLEYVKPVGQYRLEGGIWIYRSSVYVNNDNFHYSSAAVGIGPTLGISYVLGRKFRMGYDIRLAENRSVDWNGNHQPSAIKEFTQTLSLRYNF